MKKIYREGTKSEMIVTVLNSDEKFSLISLPNGEQIQVLNNELTDINAD